MKGDTKKFGRFELMYEIISWFLSVGLVVLAYASPSVLGKDKPMLYLVSILFGFAAIFFVRIIPLTFDGWIKYEAEDKVFVESLVIILLLTTYLFLMRLPPSTFLFIFLLPILIEATVLHEKVILAESAFSLIAIVFLKLATFEKSGVLSIEFLSDLLIFFSVVSLVYFLTKQLRITSARTEEISNNLSSRLDQIQVISQVVQQSEYFSKFDKLLSKVGEITSDSFNSEQCGFFLFDDDENKLILHRASVGFKDQDRDVFSLKENLDIIEGIYEKKESVFSDWTKESSAEVTEFIGASHLNNIMMVPLYIRNNRLGVVMLANKRDGVFNADDINFLKLLAGFMSTLIQSANIFQKVEKERKVAERMTKLLVGREIKMRDLKREVERINKKK